ncbi:solute carrier family 46 member 3-like [Penaeus chinensis]|uniref:solute carrier family 46 member 3-like n=1 Tax=Penaeus chinensis TaxID=139456 RepID=UPI001FB6E386|nr:solute carrier family 46 member 3-like [Penaeus chinensis]
MESEARTSKTLGKVRGFLGDISIEPIMFLFYINLFSRSVVKENLKLDRFCRITLGYDEEDCASLNDGHHGDIQAETQKLDSVFLFYEKLVSTVVPLVLVSFAATWSDRSGRKALILLCLLGDLLYVVIYLLESLFPSWPPEVLLLASFLNSLGGGMIMLLMACYSFMADKTNTKTRTIRMAIMNSVMHMGGPIGTVLGAWVFAAKGYVWVFGLGLVIIVLCLLLVIFFIRDKDFSSDTKKGDANDTEEAPGDGNDTKEAPSDGHDTKEAPGDTNEGKRTSGSPCDPRNVVDLFWVCFRRRPGRGRSHLILLMLIMLGQISMTPHNLYLWSRRVYLWDENQYSVYSTINQVMEQTTSLIAAPVLHKLAVHDCLMGAGASFLCFLKMLTLGLITSPSQWWVIYLFVFVPNAITSAAIRAQMSKICGADEVGRVFSMLAIAEVLWPLADSAIYTAVYTSTLDFYPSYEHLVSALYGFLALCGFLGLRLSLEHVESRAGRGAAEEELAKVEDPVKSC